LGQYQTSVDLFEKIPENAPEKSLANLYAGLGLLEMGRGSAAKQKFTAVAKKDPRQFRTVMQEIGLVELLQNLSRDPENPGLILSAAQYYNMKKEYMKALEYSLKALDKDPLNEKILQSIVFSYRALGEAGNVLDYATRYRMVDKDNLHLEYILGEMYAKTLRCEKAVVHLKSALKKDDTYQNAQKLLDDCRRTLAMKKESIAGANSS